MRFPESAKNAVQLQPLVTNGVSNLTHEPRNFCEIGARVIKQVRYVERDLREVSVVGVTEQSVITIHLGLSTHSNTTQLSFVAFERSAELDNGSSISNSKSLAHVQVLNRCTMDPKINFETQGLSNISRQMPSSAKRRCRYSITNATSGSKVRSARTTTGRR